MADTDGLGHTAERRTGSLKELAGFIRINICLYTASLAAIGYLLYGRPDTTLAYVMLSAFLGCAGAYAYNNTTDLKEDLINRKRLNYFSDKGAGKAIVVLCFAAGFYFASKLPTASMLAYGAFPALGLAYSAKRIKKYLLLKNIWTAFGVSQSLLIGAFATAAQPGLVFAYLTVFLMLLAGSIIADMRDLEGDRKTGIKTLPVKIGMAHTARVLYLLFTAITALVLIANLRLLGPLLLATPVCVLFVKKERFVDAQNIGGISLISLMAWLLITGRT